MRGGLPWRLMIMLVLAGIVGAVTISRGVAAASRDQLAVRVQQLEDNAQIERLLLDYGDALDHRDFAGYSRLFAADGVWSGSIGTFRGPAAIQAAMEKAFTPSLGTTHPATGKSFHLLTNAMIDVSGDEARAISKWTFVQVVHNKPVIANAGRYEDRLVRENGHWRFRSRVAPSVLSPVSG